jgi:Na+-transporting NADH:ubiquinone oxidoreductase subunit NqrA
MVKFPSKILQHCWEHTVVWSVTFKVVLAIAAVFLEILLQHAEILAVSN